MTGTIGPRTARLAKLLTWPIPTGMKLPILSGPLRGMRWIVGAAAGEAKGLSVVLHRAEREQLELAREWTGPESVCFDVGANVGLYTLLFARYGKQVFAFEPLPRNVSYLYRAIHANRLRNATVIPWAVSETFQTASFDLGENCAVGSMADGGPQPAVCIGLDEFAETYQVEPDLIKIDVEGAEESVLRGAADLLARKKPKLLLSTHNEQAQDACLKLLREAGYQSFQKLDEPHPAPGADFAVSPE